MLSLLHFLCSLCLDVGAKSEFEASLGKFSFPLFLKGAWAFAGSRQVCTAVWGGGGPELDKPSQEPLGLGAGRLQWVGARGTVGVGFHSNQ